MPEIRKFSLHPKLAAVIDLALNATTLVLFPRLADWHWFGLWFSARAIIWALFIRLVYYPPELSRWRHFLSLIFFNFGIIVSLSIFVDWLASWYLLTGMFVFFSAASFWILPAGEGPLSFYQKPFRRWLFLMDAFGLAGFWCGIFAILSFQMIGDVYSPLLYLLGAAVSALMSLWWWRAYGLEYSRRLWISTGISFILTYELAWVTGHWPLGFMVSGITMIWFWYNWWLIMRFNLTKEGIDWKKQRFFIISSLLLFAALMIAAKWR